MRNHRRLALLTPAALVLVVTFAAPTVEAGGGVGLHLGSGGFGVSVGFGDWSVYTRSWSDPYWSIDFNASLAGYGQWVWVDGLGRVWRPWVAASWRPYTHGRWVSTGCGWTWVAYEPWGYVSHHYGSWAYCSFGWAWVPGYSYSCANVVWVNAGGYVGWYARPPRGWSHAAHGFRHGYRHGYQDGFGDGYHNGYSDGWHDARYATYVGWNDFGVDDVSRRTVSHRIASQDRIETHANAPTSGEIQRRGGALITQTRLARRTATVDGHEITIARPEGVARSIERNAADTVGRALSEEALHRRQPLVRPRAASATAAARSSRPSGVSRETESQQEQPPTTASRPERSGISSRSTYEQLSTAGSSRNRTTAPESASGLRVGRDETGSDHGRSRAAADSGTTNSMRSRSAPRASSHPQPVSRDRQSAQSPRRTSESRQSQNRTSQSATSSRQDAPTQQRAAEPQQSRSRSRTSSTQSEKKEESERKSEDRPRSRRR